MPPGTVNKNGEAAKERIEKLEPGRAKRPPAPVFPSFPTMSCLATLPHLVQKSRILEPEWKGRGLLHTLFQEIPETYKSLVLLVREKSQGLICTRDSYSTRISKSHVLHRPLAAQLPCGIIENNCALPQFLH